MIDVTVYFGQIKTTAEGFQANCPKCDDHEKKFYYNTEKGVGCCFHSECAWFKERGGATERRLVAFFSRTGTQAAPPDVVESAPEADVELPEEFELLDELNPVLRETIYDYLESRGLAKKVVRAARAGYCQTGKHWGYMVFPVFDDEGQAVYWQGRRFKKRTPKFYNPPSSKKSELIYCINPVHHPRRIILVESIMNTLTLEHIGKTSTNLVMGLMGSSLSDIQRDKVLEHERNLLELVIALDPDALRPAADIAERFQGVIPAVKIARFPEGEDINSIGRMKAWDSIYTAQVYDPRKRVEFLLGASRE